MKFNIKGLRAVVDRNFTWKDLNPKRFSEYDVVRSNTMCPFHENHDTPASRFYYDEEDDLWILYCYSEKKAFHPYHYVELIMCKEWEKYTDILDFLKHNMSEGEIIRQYEAFMKSQEVLTENNYQKKVDYINNVYSETGNTVDYIEGLYTA